MLEIKGVAAGAALSEMRSTFTGVSCSQKSEAMEICLSFDEFGFGGVTAVGVGAEVVNERVATLVIYINESDFGRVASALEAKYGKPTADTTEVIRNRMGAAFDNRQAGWEWDGSRLLAIQRAGKIDRSSISLHSLELAAKASQERAEQAKEAAKDL